MGKIRQQIQQTIYSVQKIRHNMRKITILEKYATELEQDSHIFFGTTEKPDEVLDQIAY